VLLLDVRLDYFGVVERERERVEDLGGTKLRVALEDSLHLRAVPEERVNAPDRHTRAIDKGTATKHGWLYANMGMWNEYDRKRQGETSRPHS